MKSSYTKILAFVVLASLVSSCRALKPILKNGDDIEVKGRKPNPPTDIDWKPVRNSLKPIVKSLRYNNNTYTLTFDCERHELIEIKDKYGKTYDPNKLNQDRVNGWVNEACSNP
ncbi:MAG: hypothetical protein ICV63_01680 [Coleofasciculus sp. Co-bin14]|nr:hypothetical protein [Coleofasciculus sp. Co-bin14]